MFMTRSFSVTPKTTEQHLIARNDKFLAYVTNNKKNSARRFVLLKLSTDKHEVSRGLFAIAELLVVTYHCSGRTSSGMISLVSPRSYSIRWSSTNVLSTTLGRSWHAELVCRTAAVRAAVSHKSLQFLISRSRCYSTSSNSKTVQDRAIFTMADQ